MKSPRFFGKPKKPKIMGETSSSHAADNPRAGWPFIMRNVQGHSMMPVLPPNTLVTGWKRYRKLQVGDVIIFSHHQKEKIKRISEIKDGQLFVLGDLPDASTDSRQFGWIDQSAVIAKVIYPRDVQQVPADQ
jgi:nickel-type superoxide dismutase maturation protease